MVEYAGHLGLADTVELVVGIERRFRDFRYQDCGRFPVYGIDDDSLIGACPVDRIADIVGAGASGDAELASP